MEKKKTPTKRKQTIKEENENSSKKTNKISKEKSKKQEKKKEIKIKKLTKKQLIIICSIVTICILGAALCTFIAFNNKETKIETCSVQFNTNGGIELDQINIDCGGTIKEPDIPYKEGFDFVGWYLDGEEYDFLSKVNKNLVIEAKWEAQEGIALVTVSFDTDGGSELNNIEIKKNTPLVKPQNPSKKGYIFVGWYLDNKQFDFTSTIVEENITLVAKWKKQNTNSETQEQITNNTTDEQTKCNVFILKGNKDKTIYVGFSAHVSHIWPSAVVVWTEEYCDVKYTSSNESIATINKEGFVNAKKTGKTKFTGCVTDKLTNIEIGCFNGTAEIKTNNLKKPTKINCYNYVSEIGEKNSVGMSWEGVADVDDFSNYYYITEIINSNKKVIKILNTKNAIYEAVTPGKSEITIKTNTGLTTSCSLVVTNKKAKEIKIANEHDNISVGDVIKLKTTINPADSTESFYWSSSSPEVATIDNNGNLTAKSKGYTYINVYNDAKTITNQIIIHIKGKKVKSISLNKNELNLNVNESETLVSSIYPTDAENQTVFWTSDDTEVANVNNNGKVTAKGEGTATITVKTEDGGYTDKCVVTVKSIKVNSVSLNKTSISLVKGDTETLRATINPNNATYQNVTWSSSDTNVVTVSSDGKVTAKAKGTATITVKTNDGGYSDSCIVTVTNPPLTAKGSVGVKTLVYSGAGMSSTITTRGVNASIEVSGGTGTYTYYYIKLYKEGKLIGSTSDTSRNELFVACGTNGSFTINGTYTMEYEVRDSDGNVKTGTSSSTISGF